MKYCFVVGIPRSGTSWVWSLIANHPDVQPYAREGTTESNLFYEYTPLQARDRLKLFAREVYDLDDTVEWIVEKTPDHLMKVDDILSMFPDAQIVYVVRNKADTVRSIAKYFKMDLVKAEMFYDMRDKYIKNMDDFQGYILQYDIMKEDPVNYTIDLLQHLNLQLPSDIEQYIIDARKLVPTYAIGDNGPLPYPTDRGGQKPHQNGDFEKTVGHTPE